MIKRACNHRCYRTVSICLTNNPLVRSSDHTLGSPSVQTDDEDFQYYCYQYLLWAIYTTLSIFCFFRLVDAPCLAHPSKADNSQDGASFRHRS